MSIMSFEEGHRVRKVLLWGLFIWITINHLIRATAGLPSSLTPGESNGVFAVPDFMPNFKRMLINPLNSFRISIGEEFMQLASVCPQAYEDGCRSSVNFTRTVLGLNP